MTIAGSGLAQAAASSASAAAETAAPPAAAGAATWPVKCTYWVKVTKAPVRKNPSRRSKPVRWKDHHDKITSPERCGWFIWREGRPWVKVNTTATRSRIGWMELWHLE